MTVFINKMAPLMFISVLVASYIYNAKGRGVVAKISEYPWLARIEYEKDNNLRLLCGGVLISGRYVLTAGHCVVGQVLKVASPKNVRLGEYDTDNNGPDCDHLSECTDGAISIEIEQIIPHPEYDPSDRIRRHDIALIRLKEMAPYTDFIRPICLPTSDVTSLSQPETRRSHVAGWGAFNATVRKSNIKLKATVPLVALDTCQLVYRAPKRNITLWNGQLCAGGEIGKDSCKGDSGGPLMYENISKGQNVFEVIGIFSFGPVVCGLEDIPDVYTKVFEYNQWIQSQIKP